MLKAVKVVSLNSDTEAALAIVSQIAPAEESKTAVWFYAIVYCLQDDAFSKVRQSLSEAETAFTTSPEPLSERLPQVLQATIKSLAGAQNIQALVACCEKNESQNSIFYLAISGQELIARLVRSKEFTDLSSMSGEGQIVSGFLQAGDRVILSTSNIKNFLHEDLSEIIELPLDLVEDEINAKLPEAQVSPIATIVIEDKEEEPSSQLSKMKDILDNGSKPEPTVIPKEVNIQLPRVSKKVILPIVIILLIIGAIAGFFKFGHIKKPSILVPSVTPTKAPTSTVSNLNQVSDFPVWLDLNLIKSGMSADSLSQSLGKILILDPKRQVLVSVDLKTKSPQLLAGADKLGQAQLSSINRSMAWVYSTDKGLLDIDIGNQTVTNPIKADKDWGDIAAIYGFGGNVYLLDKNNPSTHSGQIWKYVPITTGYSDKQPYLKSTNVDLSQFIKLQIDSSIWVLKRGAQVDRYTQGVADFFAFSGLDKPVKDLKTFFVSDETDNAYFLDTDNNRLIVTDKQGKYIAQYVSDKFQTFSDFVVDEPNKKVYFLAKDKIYQMDLK